MNELRKITVPDTLEACTDGDSTSIKLYKRANALRMTGMVLGIILFIIGLIVILAEFDDDEVLIIGIGLVVLGGAVWGSLAVKALSTEATAAMVYNTHVTARTALYMAANEASEDALKTEKIS